MVIKLSQSLKQSQNLMMTPQLQQAIKLLTLNHMEMKDAISEEMVENPLLEEYSAELANENGDSSDYVSDNIEKQNKETKSEDYDERPIMASSEDHFDWGTYVESFESTKSGSSLGVSSYDEEAPNYENFVSGSQSLADHLMWQLRMENLTDEEFELSSLIIGNINDDGYLSVSFGEVVEQSNLSPEDAEDLLLMIQRFDPIGCGSRDLKDCLLAQAIIMEERSPLLEKIIKTHLNDLQNRNFSKIAKLTGVLEELVIETATILKQFYPKPGRLVSSQDTQYVVPDIFVEEVSGKFSVVVNDEGIPRLRISKHYKEMLTKKESVGTSEAKEYVEEKLKSAVWLIKSIQNRQNTITKVAQAIVKKQQDFFRKGPKHLKPMILKNIAEEIGMHESTVSRVTSNKYLHSPIGVFELKFFFNAGLGGGKNGGSDVSSEVLKIKIKNLLDNENPKRPLSDQKIGELLDREGVKVARRTVAKYREMMGYLSSSKRKMK
ncbi:MAG: RNA polymerase factor sigma-54 [Bdellovibrionota bacterium]|nr:RNA polymerase factor sigma-54 [Bdellovibrionota bacterium]